MTNAVGFAAGTGLISREDLARSLNNAAMTMPRVGGDKPFLKMDKGNGEWIYGQDETLVEAESLWAVNPASFQHGYISWDSNQQVEGEVMVPISRPLPDVGSLRVQGSADGKPTGENGWQYQMSVEMVCISGDDAGTAVAYKQSSTGARKAFASLTDAIANQIQKGADEIVPVVVMKSTDYKHKKWGRIFNPVFEIEEWRSMDDDTPAAKDVTAATKTVAKEATKTAEQEPDAAEEAELARAYAAEEAKKAEGTQAPRRRVRRG